MEVWLLKGPFKESWFAMLAIDPVVVSEAIGY